MKVIAKKNSKSGKSQVLGLLNDDIITTPLGTMRRTRIYNIALQTTELEVGDEVDVDLADFRIEESEYVNPDTGEMSKSYWLR